jgi:hypothetical protein
VRRIGRWALSVGSSVSGLTSCRADDDQSASPSISSSSERSSTVAPWPVIPVDIAKRHALPDCGQYDATVPGPLPPDHREMVDCLLEASRDGRTAELRVLVPNLDTAPTFEISRVLPGGRREVILARLDGSTTRPCSASRMRSPILTASSRKRGSMFDRAARREHFRGVSPRLGRRR